ncbi:Piso0_000599 [Millerozyma farinosa CBS 7064]|uniref:Piso0_000599 protein n=1 Tax=Pichia sorbitophila (strain ATCC MYA-4447 / BCRC 22081 / CBS 7064 / NBRC 10061 / NRRL Y-12695) TaxID=559304 RepID=G8YSU0_PICSO|nr:Piso0_000599 [Millerozyma farinosa CBS 7064]CCE73552.1 Piso0_000599 [Millerozyma farinosa CBS 7064]
MASIKDNSEKGLSEKEDTYKTDIDVTEQLEHDAPDSQLDPIHRVTSALSNNEFDDEAIYNYEDPRNYSTNFVDEHNPMGLRKPTKQEANTLRRVLGRADWACYLICIAEFAERASYYSCQTLLSNFITYKLPTGSSTGKLTAGAANPGALGLGVPAANAIAYTLTFVAYVVPLYAGYVADAQIGKFKAIWIGVFCGFVAHILLVIAAAPAVIKSGHAIAPTAIAIITLAFGTGFIKPNLLPLLMDQYPEGSDMVKVLPSGEKVIMDRQKSLERMTLVFYWAINVGALFPIPAVYIERRIGYWFGFFIPIIIYLIIPLVFWFVNGRLRKEKIQGSVLVNIAKILRVSFRGNWIKRLRQHSFWDYARPSKMRQRGEEFYVQKKQKAITWDDQWVLDVKEIVSITKVFLYFVVFNLCDAGGSGATPALTAQSGSMTSDGTPNDMYSNFNPITIVGLIPLLDYGIYPLLRRFRIDFLPVWRITLGFLLAASSQAAAAIIQQKIYNTIACGYNATECVDNGIVAPINAWVSVVPYILSAASECFANTTAYELGYTRAPPLMKGLVQALFLLMTGIAAAIGDAISPALKDPHLVWYFAGLAIVGTVFAFAFLIHFRNLHKDMRREARMRSILNRREMEKADGEESNIVPITSVGSALAKNQ